MKPLDRERIYQELSRRAAELSEDRRRAFDTYLSEDRMNITNALKEAIKISGWTPASLAWQSGLNPSQLYRFLEGQTSLTLESVDQLAEVLGLKLLMNKADATKPTAKATKVKATKVSAKATKVKAAKPRTKKTAKEMKEMTDAEFNNLLAVGSAEAIEAGRKAIGR